jgi:ABC-type transporter Mla subunit MlaD
VTDDPTPGHDRRDRRQLDHLASRIQKLELLLERVSRQVDEVTDYAKDAKQSAAKAARESEMTNSRVAHNERDIDELKQAHHADLDALKRIVFGDPTSLKDAGGVVGTLRSTNLMVRVNVGILVTVIVPACLTILAVYMQRLL